MRRRVLVKICGLTRLEDAEQAVAAGADMVGFIFVPGTPRAVDPDAALWVRDLRGAETVGVFRDAPLDRILEIRDALALDRVQLHGEEPGAFLETLGPRTLRRVPVVDGAVDWRRVGRLARVCLPLIDPGAGSGESWAWREMRPPPGLRFGLAGGLGPDTVAAAVRLLEPALVDVSSGVERAPGRKDPARVEAFVRAAGAARSPMD